MTIYNLGNIKGEKGDRGECAPGPTGPPGIGIKSIEQITTLRFKICLTDGSEYYINYGGSTPTPASMTLTGDVSTLMAGETAHLMAAVYDEHHALIPGQIVTMGVYKTSDDSLVKSLTVTDVGNGTYTANYTVDCIGDLYIKADCMLLSEIYGISCEDYQAMIDNSDEFKWSIPSAVSSSSIFGYSENGWRFGNASSFSRMPLNFELAYPFSVEFTVNNRVWLAPITMFRNNNNNYIEVLYGEGGNWFRYKQNGAGMPTGDVNYDLPNGSIIKFELTSDTIKTYVDDNLIDTRNHSLNQTGLHFYFETGSSRENTIKNFKIQPL